MSARWGSRAMDSRAHRAAEERSGGSEDAEIAAESAELERKFATAYEEEAFGL